MMSGKKKTKLIKIPSENTLLKIDKTFDEAVKATMVAADKKIKIQKQKDH